ncbi:Erg28-like protein [Russula brevipes]|nr:Erg28-like protein [Russula brevipes]
MAAANFLPQSDGKLPVWQIAVAATAVFNTMQNFLTLRFTKRLYNNVPATFPVTPLHARTFGVWTLTASVVRLYAAYNIHNKAIYDMALLTYLFAFAHFSSEILIFRTAKITIPILTPVIVATTSLVWMISQYDFYIKA